MIAVALLWTGIFVFVGALLANIIRRKKGYRTSLLLVNGMALGLLLIICAVHVHVTAARYRPCIGATPSSADLESEYFAVQTLTSVGYGYMLNVDPLKADKFYAVSTFAMAIGGLIWTVSVGFVAGMFIDAVKWFANPGHRQCPACRNLLP